MSLQAHQPQATHLPMLIAAVAQSSGPVLELGCGDTSTPMLHAMLHGTGRLLWSIDNELPWVERFALLRREWHLIEQSMWPLPVTSDARFGVVLVDHAPAHQRAADMIRLKDRADFLILHDAEGEGYGLEQVRPHFKHVQIDKTFLPWTACLSNVKPLVIDW